MKRFVPRKTILLFSLMLLFSLGCMGMLAAAEPAGSGAITLKAGEGSLDGESTVTLEEGKLPELPEPTREGWTFAGWYTEPITEIYLNGGDTTGDGVQVEKQKLELTEDGLPKKDSSVLAALKEQLEGTSAENESDSDIIERHHSWLIEFKDGTLVKQGENLDANVSDLYAMYKPNLVKIDWNFDGWNNRTGALHTSRPYGGYVYPPDVEDWDGHEFLGWSREMDGDADLQASYVYQVGGSKIPETGGSVTFYAVWRDKPKAGEFEEIKVSVIDKILHSDAGWQTFIQYELPTARDMKYAEVTWSVEPEGAAAITPFGTSKNKATLVVYNRKDLKEITVTATADNGVTASMVFPLSHSWYSDYSYKPRCDAPDDGYVLYKCRECMLQYKEKLPRPEHTFVETHVEVTCIADGYDERVCSVCGLEERTTTPATGHSWSETKVVKVGSGKFEMKTCTVCGTVDVKAVVEIPSEPEIVPEPETEPEVKLEAGEETEPDVVLKEEETEPEDSSEPETTPEQETESESETVPGGDTRPETNADPESKTEPGTAADAESKAEPETEEDAESKAGPETEADPENETKPGMEVIPEDEKEPETETAPETEPETEADPENERKPEIPETEAAPELTPAPEVTSASEVTQETETVPEKETEPETEAASAPKEETQPETEAAPELTEETQPETEAAPAPKEETQPETEAAPELTEETQPKVETAPEPGTGTQPETEATLELGTATQPETEVTPASEKAPEKENVTEQVKEPETADKKEQEDETYRPSVSSSFSGGSSGGGSRGGSGSGGSLKAKADPAATAAAVTPLPIVPTAEIREELPDYVEVGSWDRAADGSWTFKDENGEIYTNRWAAVYNPYANTAAANAYDWFRFDAAGHLITGWYVDPTDGCTYYMNPLSDGTQGKMMTGWVVIDGKEYYFNPNSDGQRGRMYRNETTPDGYYVDENGVKIR